MPILSPEEKRYLAIREEYNKLYKNHSKHNTLIPTLKGISIIVLASEQSEPYIEECLNSIQKQTYFLNNPYQIIVAIDGSEKTLQKVESIKSQYPNIGIQSTLKRVGKFVMLNNTLKSCRFNSIMHFNAEDIMAPDLAEEVMQYIDNFDIVKFDYQDFQGDISNVSNNKFWFNGGICVYSKHTLQLSGGFQPWVYAADIEMVERVFNHVRVKKIEKLLYYKREMPGDMKLGTKKHPRKEFLQKIRRYSIKENVCITPGKVEFKIGDLEDNENNEFNFYVDKLEEPIKKEIKQTPTAKSGVSILITAYKSQNFIEECLDSIENQTYFKDNNDYEILLGLDACQETLSKVLEIKHKYRNISIFMMKENKGPYVALNTLLDFVNYDHILIFGSDDIMMPNLIEQVSTRINDSDILRLNFVNFTKDISKTTPNIFRQPALGVILAKKAIFDLAGGYQSWRCSGDYELLKRLENKVKITQYNDPLFYRRDHPASLSNSTQTSLTSQLRLQYNKQVRNYKYGVATKIKKEINNYKLIFSTNENYIRLNKNEEYDICVVITTFNREQMIKKLLDDIEKYKSKYKILTIVFDDGSPNYLDISDNNIRYVKFLNNHGKKLYWKLITETMKYCENVNAKYFIYLPDDVRLSKNFFDESINTYENINDARKICLSLLMPIQQIGKTNWTNFIPIEKDGCFLTQWCDLCFISNKRFFEALNYKIDEIPLNRWDTKSNKRENLSSGVGKNISERLHIQNLNMYHVKSSFVIHGDHDSVMNPGLRKIEKLTT